MPLKLSLKPHEKFVVNGAVMVNGDRKADIVIQNRASILRERDVLRAEEINTPLRRIYFPIQMMYLEMASGAANVDAYYAEFHTRMAEFVDVISNAETIKACAGISRDVLAGQYYRALTACRKLFDYEQERLNYVPECVSEDA